MHQRLKDANINIIDKVGPKAAVYCSAILQYLTSKVITEAVKVIESSDERSPNNNNKVRQISHLHFKYSMCDCNK